MSNPQLSADDIQRYRQIFMPLYAEKLKEMSAAVQPPMFAYYTTAETALRIIESGEVWMRLASTMNDMSEVRHGFACIRDALLSPAMAALKEAGSRVGTNFVNHGIAFYTNQQDAIGNAAFLACVSEHDQSENKYGRLSMWRAYGGRSGVALILRGSAFAQDSDDCGFWSSPVVYGDAAEARAVLATIARNVDTERDFLVSREPVEAGRWLALALQSGVLCLKHPAFKEEREWRILHIEGLDSNTGLKERNAAINGIPQPIKAIQLKHPPEGGMPGLVISDLLEKVIIGPTEYPAAIGSALIRALLACGVTDARSRVQLSDVPLRIDRG